MNLRSRPRVFSRAIRAIWTLKALTPIYLENRMYLIVWLTFSMCEALQPPLADFLFFTMHTWCGLKHSPGVVVPWGLATVEITGIRSLPLLEIAHEQVNSHHFWEVENLNELEPSEVYVFRSTKISQGSKGPWFLDSAGNENPTPELWGLCMNLPPCDAPTKSFVG